MLNVHSKVKAEMKTVVITDEAFFTGKIFKAHLEDIATTVTKRYKGFRKVRVFIVWDRSENSFIAYTDNNNIYINAGAPFIFTKDRETLYKFILGLFGHELGHILVTDFVAAHSYVNALTNGIWFPRDPRTPTFELKSMAKLFRGFCDKSPEHLALITKYLMELDNMLEDGLVEEFILRTYPGILGGGLKAVRNVHWGEMKDLNKLIAEEQDGKLEHHKLFTMFALVLQYAKFGEIKIDGVPFDDEHIVLLGRIIPLIDEFMQSPPRERFAIVSEIALVLYPLLQDCIEKFLEEKEKNKQNGQGDSSQSNGAQGQGNGSQGGGSGDMSSSQADEFGQMLEEIIKNMAGNTTKAKGNSQACASNKSNAQSNTQASKNRVSTRAKLPVSDEFSSEEKSVGSGDASGDEDGEEEGFAAGSGLSEEDENGENSAVSDAEESEGGEGGEVDTSNGSFDNGRKQFGNQGSEIGYGEGECSENSGTGEIEYNDDYEAQIDKNLARKFEILSQKIKENEAVKTLEGERIRDLNSFAKEISYGNAHRGTDIRINRAAEITDSMVLSYNEVAPTLLPIAKNLAKKFVRIADSARQGGRLNGLLMGRKFDAGSAYRKDGRVFMKNIMPQSMQPLAVALLIDESGSMANERERVAMATAIIIQNFCEQLDIPLAIYGHSTGSYDCEMYSYIEFDTYTKNDKYRLADIGARGCNRDGAALRYTAERLMSRPEEAKLLILISDGQPNGNGGYSGAAAEADLRGIHKEYKKKGVCFCAAAIGDDKDVIKNIYGDAFLDISNLKELPVKLVKVLEKYLKVV